MRGNGYELWANECKECLRSRLIGRRVRIIVDYEKPFATTHHLGATIDASKAASLMRYFATVKALPSMRNVALMLLQEGLVTCSTRVTATTALTSPVRSAGKGSAPSHLAEKNYSCEIESAGYLIAEAEAAAKGRGLHGAGPPPGVPLTANSPGVVDLTTDTKRSRPFLLQLIQKAAAAPPPTSSSSSGADRAPGVCYYRGAVEFVYSGSRIKVLIPSENCMLSLTLAQVRCPLPSRVHPAHGAAAAAAASAAAASSATRLAEPLSEESRSFTRRHVQQRTVELRIDDVDKNGIALGRLYVQVQVAPPPGMPTTPSGGALNKPPLAPSFMIRPYAVILVAEGLAKVDRKFASPLEDRVSEKEMADLLAAQEAAIAAKKGLWGIPGYIEAEELANAPPALATDAVAEDEGNEEGSGEEVQTVAVAEDEGKEEGSGEEVQTVAAATAAGVKAEAVGDATENSVSAGGDEAEAVAAPAFATPAPKSHARSSDAHARAGTVASSSTGGIKPSGPQLRGGEETVVVRLSAITGGTVFFVYPQTETRQKQLLGMQSLLREFEPDAAGRHFVDASCLPKRDQLLLCLIGGDRAPVVAAAGGDQEDAIWYRCRVEDYVGPGSGGDRDDTKLRVQFIDHGCRTVVALDEVAVLDGSNGHPPSHSGLHAKYFATSALATECVLAFLAGPDADDDEDDSLTTRAMDFLGDEVWGKDLTMQVLGLAGEGDKDRGASAGAGRLLVALYDDGGKGAAAAAAAASSSFTSEGGNKINGRSALFLSDPDDEETTAEAESVGVGAASAASPWGTRFTWGSSGNLKALGSSTEGDATATATATATGDAEAEAEAEGASLRRSVSEMSLGDIIAAEEAAAAAALRSPVKTDSKTDATTATNTNNNKNSSSNGTDERIVSVNEKVLMEGLARLSRSATRLLPRGTGRAGTDSSSNTDSNNTTTGSSSSSGGGSGKRVPRPPSLTPLALALYEHLLEAQVTARRVHLNMYRYGDPPESDDDRDKDKDIKGKDKK